MPNLKKAKFTITFEATVDLDPYVDPDDNDYPYEEQIADEVANEDVWIEELQGGDIKVELVDLD